ncbi:MAG: acyl-CoA thioester hydrolase [Halieaceae bacterium]|jgi:acyl-CoA thioester hydrolase
MAKLDHDWDFPDPHTIAVTVAAEDIDGLQHTNNTVYIRWCELAAWSHSASLGLDLTSYQQLDRAMAMTHCEYQYLQATRQEEELLVSTWITTWDRRLTMHRCLQIIRPVDGATILRGSMKFVCIELSSGRPRRLPPEFIKAYGPAVISNDPS